MIVPKRIAILGLYNSGSTVLAGMLHRMGVHMGSPFWMISEDGHPDNFYESWELSRHVRHWWSEPTGEERTPAEDRIRYLGSWATVQEAEHPGPLGAKHPLLSLSAEDLLAAWGEETIFIRAGRPLQESIDGLARRGWFPDHHVQLQMRLWSALETFAQNHAVTTIEWNHVKADPAWAATMLAEVANLTPTDSQIRDAIALLRTPESAAA